MSDGVEYLSAKDLLWLLHKQAEWEASMNKEMMQALEAVLLFHSGGEWTQEKQQRWKEITGDDEATTKTLCDYVREKSARMATNEEFNQAKGRVFKQHSRRMKNLAKR